MSKLMFLLILFIMTLNSGFTQAPTLEKDFLILHSTKSYEAALQLVNEGRQKLDVPVDLRNYFVCPENRLKNDLICACGENHGYIPRGRFDDGIYLSIENSNSYSGFTKNYYIVMLASGTKGDELILSALNMAKTHYANAYIRNTPVHLGCSH